MKRLGLVLCSASLLLGSAACSGDGGGNDNQPDAGVPPTGLTYYKDVKPILDAKCAGCHTAGGIAPFELEDHEAAFEFRFMIKEAVTTRIMPPWLAASGCDDYVMDRSLSDAQIQTIADWVDQGAVKGDPADEGPPLDTGPDFGLKDADVSLSMPMPVEYTMVEEPDEYRCFVLDWPETQTKYVTGFRARPGNQQVVHHVIAFVAATPQQVSQVEQLDAQDPAPGYKCFGGPGFQADRWLGAWAPGSEGNQFPPGTGIKVAPGSKIVLQMHYNSLTAGVQPDRTSVDVRLADSVDKEAWVQPWTNFQWVFGNGMRIPAGEADVVHSFTFDPTGFISDGQPFVMYSMGYHQHQLGRRGKVEIHRADGTVDCLLDIPRWNFHWQLSYGFVEPKVFNPGDKLYMECHWDNSQGTQDVYWGEGTTDEMCLIGFYATRQ